jgi:hypothetical protein
MDSNQQKEQFSNAFLHAIASVSECSISKPSVDDDSVDWTLSKKIARRPRLDLQLKCTGTPETVTATGISFVLKKKNYCDLRQSDLIVPRILIVVFVPEEVNDWLISGPEVLTLRRCAYWMSLRGLPDSENETAKTVYLPASQQFNVEALNDMMHTISQGGQP